MKDGWKEKGGTIPGVRMVYPKHRPLPYCPVIEIFRVYVAHYYNYLISHTVYDQRGCVNRSVDGHGGQSKQ